MVLGSRIASLRQRKGMTQAELAAELAVTPAALGAYEQGRRAPSAEMLVTLSRTLGVSVDYLLTGRPADVTELPAAAESVIRSCVQAGGRRALVVQLLMTLLEEPAS